MKVLIGPLTRDGSTFNGDVMGGLEDAFKRMSDAAGVYGGMASAAANILQGGPMLGSGILWLSAIVLLMSILGLIVAAKIVLAFLLAVGPIFIGLFLFDATRGLAEGWFRVTLSFAMAPLAVNVFGAVSLMILQPFLEILSGNAAKRLFDMGPVITIALITAVFAIVMLLGLSAVGGIARGFTTQRRRDEPGSMPRLPAPELPLGPTPSERAEQMVARIAMNDRGANFDTALSSRQDWTRRTGEVADAVASPPLLTGDRLGQAYNRSPRPVTRPGDGG
jgi:type IV secretion system protein VirB6